MLKFLNRNNKDVDREIRISITSIQGGAMVEVTSLEVTSLGPGMREANILLTPMDAAFFVSSAKSHGCCAFEPTGHGEDGGVLSAKALLQPGWEWHFVGWPEDAVVTAGEITFVVPSFVINAMRIALENMMESMMYPTTGAMEEEFA